MSPAFSVNPARSDGDENTIARVGLMVFIEEQGLRDLLPSAIDAARSRGQSSPRLSPRPTPFLSMSVTALLDRVGCLDADIPHRTMSLGVTP
jgi:hypothetical protein